MKLQQAKKEQVKLRIGLSGAFGTGKLLKKWCDTDTTIENIFNEINQCLTVEGLRHIYTKYPNLQEAIKEKVLERKQEIESSNSEVIDNKQIVESIKPSSNGVSS
ncbi:hypothetical protein [Tenacibaculum mesophilum]|uniref:hypothetical protein n=1 Tax=Tenacibaculum mesophilum TaxID=104268 RepID=UPI003F617FC2